VVIRSGGGRHGRLAKRNTMYSSLLYALTKLGVAVQCEGTKGGRKERKRMEEENGDINGDFKTDVSR